VRSSGSNGIGHLSQVWSYSRSRCRTPHDLIRSADPCRHEQDGFRDGTEKRLLEAEIARASRSLPEKRQPFARENDSQLEFDHVTALHNHGADSRAFTRNLGVITFHGTDRVSAADATRIIQILPDPVNLPPNIGAISPANGTDLGYADVQVSGMWTKAVLLSATATDPEGTPLPDSAFTWTTKYTDPSSGVTTTQTLGTGKNLSTHLVGLCFSVQHLVALTVSDGVNQSSKSAVYTVHLLC
jgi:hypothetical protein